MLVNEVLLAGSAGFRSLHGAEGQVKQLLVIPSQFRRK